MPMWNDCLTNPPHAFERIEIKTVKGQKYLGYYSGHGTYLDSYEHLPIKKARFWRYPPEGSVLVSKFMQKIAENLLPKKQEEVINEETD